MGIGDNVKKIKRSVKEFIEGHELQLDNINRVVNHTPLGPVRDHLIQLRDDAQKIYDNTQELRHQRKLTDFAAREVLEKSVTREAADDTGNGPGHGAGEINVHLDKPHGGTPLHADMTMPLPEFGEYGGAHKTEVDTDGRIIGEQVWVGKKHADIMKRETGTTGSEGVGVEAVVPREPDSEGKKFPKEATTDGGGASVDANDKTIADETRDLAGYGATDSDDISQKSLDTSVEAGKGAFSAENLADNNGHDVDPNDMRVANETADLAGYATTSGNDGTEVAHEAVTGATTDGVFGEDARTVDQSLAGVSEEDSAGVGDADIPNPFNDGAQARGADQVPDAESSDGAASDTSSDMAGADNATGDGRDGDDDL